MLRETRGRKLLCSSLMTYLDLTLQLRLNSRGSTIEEKGRKGKQTKANKSPKVHLRDVGEALEEEDR